MNYDYLLGTMIKTCLILLSCSISITFCLTAFEWIEYPYSLMLFASLALGFSFNN
jgi:hypothetical protein